MSPEQAAKRAMRRIIKSGALSLQADDAKIETEIVKAIHEAQTK